MSLFSSPHVDVSPALFHQCHDNGRVTLLRGHVQRRVGLIINGVWGGGGEGEGGRERERERERERGREREYVYMYMCVCDECVGG